MPRKKTHEEFVKEVYELVGDEYIVLSEYKNNKIKIDLKHNKCGNIIKITPNSFLSGTRCSFCSHKKAGKKIRKTNDEFLQEVRKIVGDEYTVLGEYEKSNIKIPIRHNKCGRIFEPTPNNFLRGSRCPYCQHRSYKKTHEEFINEVYKLVKNEYEVLGRYVNNDTKIKLRHNNIKCNYHTFYMTPNSFLRGQRCPKCAGKLKKSSKLFKQEILKLVGKEYILMSKYNGNKNKVVLLHKKCGNIFKTTPNNFLRGSRCPHCKRSKGEDIINTLLKKNNIKFEFQKTFSDCKFKSKLFFDFIINNKLILEYDGAQHFKPIEWFGGEETFKLNIKKDKIKNQYCIDNNIPLIRIPYWEYDNIEYILKNALMHFNLIQKDDTYDESVVKKYLIDENWDHDKYIEMSKNYK